MQVEQQRRGGARGVGRGLPLTTLTPGGAVLTPHWAQPPLLLDLLQNPLVQGPLLLGQRAEPSLRDLQGVRWLWGSGQ